MLFYLLLSAAVFLPLWFGAQEIVEVVHFLRPAEIAPAVTILRWAAVAFVLTNVTLVAASVLQGLDRVAASYRDQTLGWVLYLPLLGFGMLLGPKVEAVGAAWVGAYAAQLVLLSRSLTVGLRLVPKGAGNAPSFGEMLSFGGRWQVSAWADFATFQLPRFLAGATLTSGDAVTLDVAIRAGQFAVAPLFAFYPTVLPRAASLLAKEGISALSSLVKRWYEFLIPVIVIVTSILVPVEVPALAAWTGRSASSFNPTAVAAILIGTTAHASTGVLTSAQLARGEVNSILRYKSLQLLLALLFLGAATAVGLVAIAAALCLALGIPAVRFNIRTTHQLGVSGPLNSARSRRTLARIAVPQIAIPMTVMLALRSELTSWALLAVVGVTALACLSLELLFLSPELIDRYPWRPRWSETGSSPVADHLARK
jgi:O-antigen/teichoic acid export membrane protein